MTVLRRPCQTPTSTLGADLALSRRSRCAVGASTLKFVAVFESAGQTRRLFQLGTPSNTSAFKLRRTNRRGLSEVRIAEVRDAMNAVATHFDFGMGARESPLPLTRRLKSDTGWGRMSGLHSGTKGLGPSSGIGECLDGHSACQRAQANNAE